jgi:hypothetical protein
MVPPDLRVWERDRNSILEGMTKYTVSTIDGYQIVDYRNVQDVLAFLKGYQAMKDLGVVMEWGRYVIGVRSRLGGRYNRFLTKRGDLSAIRREALEFTNGGSALDAADHLNKKLNDDLVAKVLSLSEYPKEIIE